MITSTCVIRNAYYCFIFGCIAENIIKFANYYLVTV